MQRLAFAALGVAMIWPSPLVSMAAVAIFAILALALARAR
jgi:hypothetical protein